MMSLRNLSLNKYISSLALASVIFTFNSCKDDNILPDTDYTIVGMDVRMTVGVDMPKMSVQTRADIGDNYLDQVNSVWIATFSKATGEMTSKATANASTPGWKKVENLVPQQNHVPHEVEIDTKSGPSYIVAVANVDENNGVRKSDPNLSEESLSTLLEGVTDWNSFLDIAVMAPSTQQLINRPNTPLAMAGSFTNIKFDNPHYPQTSPSVWQTENFKAYTIPYSESGQVNMKELGAIHLRRLVSQVKFNLIPGSTKIDDKEVKMKLTPQSYRVINVPKYSWLYERPGSLKDGIKNFGANFADESCTEKNQGVYYVATGEYTSNNILPSTETGAEEGTYTFNFWQAENKHFSLEGQDITKYDERDTEKKENIAGAVEDENKFDQTQNNTGYFTSLTGDTWTPNNMATYVEIACTVDYDSNISVNDKGQPSTAAGSHNVARTGNARFMIHLGYMGNVASDFNCYRNTKYTYNVTINGVNDIIVEAYHGIETPGMEGMVADVTDSFQELDCHYNAYNIQLSYDDLSLLDPTTGKGFGFIVTTYDNTASGGAEKTYTEDSFKDYKSFDDIPGEIKKYVDWIELKPTSKNVLAKYTPRGMENTFNLVDAAKGQISETVKNAGWYTVFVKEYTYEADGADESQYVNGKPIWHSYVFAQPRRFYIRVTKAISSDGQSVYARSRYAGVQQSITSYYDQSAVPTSTEANKVNGSAIGVEHFNESFGLNLRKSFPSTDNKDILDENNGRYNCWYFTGFNYNGSSWEESTERKWEYFIDETNPQTVKTMNDRYGVTYAGGTMTLPKIANYRPSDKKPNQYSPQYAVNNLGQVVEANYPDYIEAISACMNRNRDNDGDGDIDANEMRWYVPAMGKYLRMLIGQEALAPNQIINYAEMPNRPAGVVNDTWGRYLFFGSEGKVLWAMEGMSTSLFNEWNENSPVAPWQVRCIRNLGTNLNTFQINSDPTIPAYTFIPNDASNKTLGGRVEMTYYQSTTMRGDAYIGNGTGANQMPVHTINENYNSLYRYGFEIHRTTTGSEYDGSMSASDTSTGYNGDTQYYSYWAWENMRNYINNNPQGNRNPCTQLNTNGVTGWRLPNIKELAIMKNLGIITKGNAPYLSCSMGVIARNGSRITPDSSPMTSGTRRYKTSGYNSDGDWVVIADNDNTHYFMCTVKGDDSESTGKITQAWQGTYHIRCVRDYTGGN